MVIIIAIVIIWGACTLLDSFSDSMEGVNGTTTFEELCQTSTVITVTSWIGGSHATNENGKRIRVPHGYPSLISTAAKYGLYPTTCDVDGGMMTLVKNKS